MIRTIEYGSYTVAYEIESDVDGNKAIIKSIATECGNVDNAIFDAEDLADMRFHCEEDYSQRQYQHYLATGEEL